MKQSTRDLEVTGEFPSRSYTTKLSTEVADFSLERPRCLHYESQAHAVQLSTITKVVDVSDVKLVQLFAAVVAKLVLLQ